MFVAEKKKFNWSMLDPLANEFRDAVKARFGERRHWMGGSIAAALYLQLSDADREAWVKKIAMADSGDEAMEEFLKEVGVKAVGFGREQGELSQPKAPREDAPAKLKKSRGR